MIILFLLQRPDCVLRIDRLFRPSSTGLWSGASSPSASPTGLENGLFQAGKLIVLSLITTFGTAAVAANGIANSIASVVNVPRTGHRPGNGDGHRPVRGRPVSGPGGLPTQGSSPDHLLPLHGAPCALILFCAAGAAGGAFRPLPSRRRHVRRGPALVRRVPAVFWPMSFTLPNALRASGDAIFTMSISLASMFICRVALSYLFACSWGLGMGLLGVWLAMFCDWIVGPWSSWSASGAESGSASS